MSTDKSLKILLCYDGSARAAHAIEVAARMFPGASVTVLNIWEPIEHIVSRYAALAPYLGEQIPEADASAEQESGSVAQEGAQIAQRAGLNATARSDTLVTSVWEAVIAASGDLGAELIVTGTRGLHGVREALAGTLSHALLQHCDTPLLAIPSPDQK